MRSSSSRKLNTGSALRTALVILLMLEILAAVMLSSRLISSGGGGKTRRISLTEGGIGTVLTVEEKNLAASRPAAEPAALNARPGYGPAMLGARVLSAERTAAQDGKDRTPAEDGTAPAEGETAGEADGEKRSGGLRVGDERKLWKTDTEVEIFRTRYDNNGDLIFTVDSQMGDSVLAPGTVSSYSFTVANTERPPLDYELSFEAWMEGDDELLPVYVRLSNGEGEWLLGGSGSWSPVRRLNEASDEGTLRFAETEEYVFEWKWPFERSGKEGVAFHDAEDTALGNEAVDRDISLHIRIMTVAEIDEELAEIDNSSIPLYYGGAAWALVNLICTILTLIIGIHQLIIFLRGPKQDDKAKEEGYYDEDEYQELIKRRKRKPWDLVPAILAVIAFILTEDVRLPMILIDRWTPLMVILLLISVTVAVMTRLKRKEEEEESGTAGGAPHEGA